MTKYKFYNEWHLGDCILHIVFLRKLVERYNCEVEYYILPEYIYECSLLIQNHPQIKIYPLTSIEPDMIQSWIGEIYYNIPNKFYYNEFYVLWFKYLSCKLEIDNLVNTMCLDWVEFKDVPKSEYDIMFINSISRSNEYDYIEAEDHKVVYELANRGSIITTKKVPGIPCTLDTNMSLLDIAKTSIGVKTLIGVNTSPIHLCMNERTLEYVKEVIVMAKSHGMNFNKNFRYAHDIFQLKKILEIT